LLCSSCRGPCYSASMILEAWASFGVNYCAKQRGSTSDAHRFGTSYRNALPRLQRGSRRRCGR
jgi:hypothetical protein